MDESSFKRIGRFSLQADLLTSNAEGMRNLFGQMIVLRAEYLPWRGRFEYVADSQLFQEVAQGTEPPEYELVGSVQTDDGAGYRTYTFVARRVW